MSVLEQLPLEISTEILSYLPSTDLLVTSKLSRHMCTVSQPLLFKNPILRSGNGTTKSALQIFLEVLLSPGGKTLANNVRSLDVQWDSRLKSDSDISLLTNAASQLGLRLPLTWEDGQLVLLLHLLPCLHNLELIPPGEGDDRLVDLIAAQTPTMPETTLPLGLRHLRRFKCTPNSTHCGVHPSMLLTLLQMPCMRELNVRLIDADTLAPGDFGAAASTSRVTHMRLLCTAVPAASLTRILSVPTGLTHFTYSAYRCDVHLADFGAALLPLKKSLRVLHLELYGFRQTPEDPGIGCLRDWPALHTLRGSMLEFLGRSDTIALVDVVPAGIRELEILSDRYWSVVQEKEKMLEMVRQKARVPGLRVLAADLGGRAGLRSLALLTAACEEAAVVLVDNSSYRHSAREKEETRRRVRTRHSCCRRINR